MDQGLREVAGDLHAPWTHLEHKLLWNLLPGVHILWPPPQRRLKAGGGGMSVAGAERDKGLGCRQVTWCVTERKQEGRKASGW